MSAKPTHVPSPVPGLTLIDPLKLPSEFRRFKNGQLFYISHCLYYPDAAARAAAGSSVRWRPAEPLQPIQRVIALTPEAIFVSDANGAMDRATRLEMIDSVCYQRVAIKTFFGSRECMHVIINIKILSPNECDLHVSFDKNPHATGSPFIAAMDLLEVMRTLVTYRRRGLTAAASREFRVFDLNTRPGVTAAGVDMMNNETPVVFRSPSEAALQTKHAVKALEAVVHSASLVCEVPKAKEAEEDKDKEEEEKYIENRNAFELCIFFLQTTISGVAFVAGVSETDRQMIGEACNDARTRIDNNPHVSSVQYAAENQHLRNNCFPVLAAFYASQGAAESTITAPPPPQECATACGEGEDGSHPASDRAAAAPPPANAAPSPQAPASAPSADYRTRITALYAWYQPEKLAQVDDMLEKYKGAEDEMMQALVTKYGPEPAA